jgi:hypothetical protein
MGGRSPSRNRRSQVGTHGSLIDSEGTGGLVPLYHRSYRPLEDQHHPSPGREASAGCILMGFASLIQFLIWLST